MAPAPRSELREAYRTPTVAPAGVPALPLILALAPIFASWLAVAEASDRRPAKAGAEMVARRARAMMSLRM